MPGAAIVRHVVTFGRVLREAGLEVGPGRVADAVRGLDAVDLTRDDDVYFTLRQTLVARRDDLELFDRAFAAWFLRGPVLASARPPRELPAELVDAGGDAVADDAAQPTTDEDAAEIGASSQELLREKDFALMTPVELERARKLVEEVARTRPRRESRRRTPHPRGDRLDLRRVVRRSLRSGGDPVDQLWRARKRVPRKLVVLCDVSGSMSAYARALLLFLHAVVGSGPGVETFAFGTRLHRLTPDLRTRDPDAALARAAAAATDLGSGTRIGASLREFNELYGRRALSRGAVVVIVSDGWERDDPAVLGRELQRLARAAYAVVWVNPLKGKPGYEPRSGGMRAALPFVDRFLPGHNLRSLEELAGTLAGIERRHAA
jgi:uncharacterized protein with von Willebrand factor type A (vWA) domain